MARAAVVVRTAPPQGVRLALALFESRLGCLDHRQPCFAPLDLSRNAHLRFVAFGRIRGLGLFEQARNLGLESRFRFDHALVTHRLVPTGVAFHLGTIHRDRAQFDQTTLSCQSHDLNEQRRQLFQVQRTEVTQRPVGWKIPCTQHPKRNIFVQLPGQLAG